MAYTYPKYRKLGSCMWGIGEACSGKLFPRSKLDWGFTAMARLTEELVKLDICRSPETVLALVICSWTVAIV